MTSLTLPPAQTITREPTEQDAQSLFEIVEDIAADIAGILIALERHNLAWATEDAHAALTRCRLLMAAL